MYPTFPFSVENWLWKNFKLHMAFPFPFFLVYCLWHFGFYPILVNWIHSDKNTKSVTYIQRQFSERKKSPSIWLNLLLTFLGFFSVSVFVIWHSRIIKQQGKSELISNSTLALPPSSRLFWNQPDDYWRKITPVHI